eukprot:TRINITY_DN4419_c0_g3_i2.p1 TRINITY_DN4419_c0_g3~~TRINITY_DN4419_c0_g3_i2.p1  ORF type:complete len:497 (+),score=60.87 TRINITY_DN4419_c0_g3_i2:245-1735(+)
MNIYGEQQQEDINFNLFFKTLKKKYNSLYQEAEKNCWLICVPSSHACEGWNITQLEIETHIFQASPYFAQEYISLNKKSVLIHENVIYTKKGFEKSKTVPILFEELFYNKEYNQFRVLCIGEPLEGSEMTSISKITFPRTRSLIDCQQYLESYPENVFVLKKINDQIEEFTNTYVFVKGTSFENHAKKKVQTIRNQAIEFLECANVEYRALYNEDNPKLSELEQIVESYVVGKMHERLFTGLQAIYQEEDTDHNTIIDQLQHVSQQDLGARPELCCRTPEAISQLREINTFTTPFEKLFCLHAVIGFITESVKKHFEQNSTSDSIATDDLIPLILFVIVKSKVKNLISNLVYLETYIFCNISNHTLGFTLTTFKAAVEHLKGDHVSKVFLNNHTLSNGSFRRSTTVVAPSNSMFGQQRNEVQQNRGISRTMSMLETPTSKQPKSNLGKENAIQKQQSFVDLDRLSRPPDVIKLNNAKEDDGMSTFLSKLRDATWIQ